MNCNPLMSEVGELVVVGIVYLMLLAGFILGFETSKLLGPNLTERFHGWVWQQVKKARTSRKGASYEGPS